MNDPNTSSAANGNPEQASQGFAGQAPQPVDRVLAALVQDTYDRAGQLKGKPAIDRELPHGWARMGDDEVRAAGIDPAMLHDSKTGFDACFYRDTQGNVALIYAGSDEGKDWKHNFGQGLGFKDAQYDQAIALAREAKLAFGDGLVMSGQSLGGGLAAAASMVNEIPAVTFNAAGVHDRTVERYGLDADVVKQQANDGLIRHYVVANDILTHLQERAFPLNLAMPDAPGHKIHLPDPDPLTTFEKLLPWKVVAHGVQVHYIESVMESMDKAGYTLPSADRREASTLRPTAENPGLETANRLLSDSVKLLAPQRQQLGLQDDQRFFNTTASVAAVAGRDGLRSIDHIVSAAGGDTVFAVQGQLHEALHARSRSDLAKASATPTEASTAELREQAALIPQVSEKPEQRGMTFA